MIQKNKSTANKSNESNITTSKSSVSKSSGSKVTTSKQNCSKSSDAQTASDKCSKNSDSVDTNTCNDNIKEKNFNFRRLLLERDAIIYDKDLELQAIKCKLALMETKFSESNIIMGNNTFLTLKYKKNAFI